MNTFLRSLTTTQQIGALFLVVFGVLSLVVLFMMRSMQLRWTRTWAEKGGRARSA